MADIFPARKNRGSKNNFKALRAMPKSTRGRKPRKGKNKNRNRKSNPKLSKIKKIGLLAETNNWLDALVSPIDHHIPVMMPDSREIVSTSLFDTWNGSAIFADYNDNTITTASYGCMISLVYGTCGLEDFLPNPGTQPGWWLIIIAMDANYVPIFDSVQRIPVPKVFDNYLSITNLCKIQRLLAGGIQILPEVEINTVSTNQFITQFHGSCVPPRDLMTFLTIGTDSFLPLIKNSPEYQCYINKEGISGRYNPCQDERQLYYYSQVELEGTDTDGYPSYWANFYMPTFLIRFHNAINPFVITDPFAGVRYSYPLIITVKLWFEAVLKTPSPIAMSKTRRDVMIETIVHMINADQNLFPCVSKGHSFKKYIQKADSFLNTVQRALNFASGVSKFALGAL